MPNEPAVLESERVGSRWINAFPSEDMVREWFHTQPLHEGMEHGPYLGGIVVIPATEKIKMTLMGNQGPYVREVERATFTPYVKVDTRVAYFWQLVRTLNDGKFFGDYVGSIKPKPQRVIENEQSPYYNANLPEGMTVYPVRQSEQNVSRYLVATWEVTIRHRESDAVVLRGQGSKQTPMKRTYPDDNAIMKAETGAVGRALGLAGILVVGTGVATAEDVQEAMAATPGTTGASAAQLPADAPAAAATSEPQLAADVAADAITPEQMGAALPDTDADLRALANTLREQMQAGAPAAWAAYLEWWKGRFGDQQLADVSGPALKGAVLKLQRDLDAATS